jgi:hypothetical protein
VRTNYSTLCFTGSVLLLALSSGNLRAQTELIVNGGFESGSAPWVLSGGATNDTTAIYLRSGSAYLWLGGVDNEIDQTYQTITIPAGASSATLSFYYNILSDENAPLVHDTFTATVRNTTGTILATILSKSNVDKDPGTGPANYHQQTFDLLPYAGQSIRIQFNSTNNSSFTSSFNVDDVTVQVGSGQPALSLLRSANNVVLSWPAGFTNFTLQGTTNSIAAPSWTAVTNVPATVNGQYAVTNPASGAFKFYRLAK